MFSREGAASHLWDGLPEYSLCFLLHFICCQGGPAENAILDSDNVERCKVASGTDLLQIYGRDVKVSRELPLGSVCYYLWDLSQLPGVIIQSSAHCTVLGRTLHISFISDVALTPDNLCECSNAKVLRSALVGVLLRP